MELHFYTTFENIQMLLEGDDINVWTKDNSRPHDIHVSLGMDKYSFHKVGTGHYQVWKKYQ
jgi:hypothetical protein